MLGLAYRDGRYGLPRDSHTAANWLTESAQSGNAYAAAMLGDAYAKGDGVPADQKTAQRWWRQAAQAGDVHAESHLGLALIGAAATQAQRDEGRIWLQRAAQGGDDQARQALGIEVPITTPVADQIDRDLGVTRGHGLVGNLERAALMDNPAAQSASELKQRALAGDNVAEFQLAMRYRDGSWGVNADPQRALSWLRRAADHGNPVAMDSLANAYDKGLLGLASNGAEAAAWRERADEVRAEPLADNR
jgi:TPR repeat protein